MADRPAALGFRVKSGYATVVLLAGPVSDPRVIDRRTIELSDPSVPESRQPYHAGFGADQSDVRKVDRLVRLVTRHANRSVAEAAQDYRAMGYQLRCAGLVVGSQIDPEAIGQPHIRAHASEGRLFRCVTEDALGRVGIGCSIWIERALYEEAAERLGQPEARIRQVAAGLGRGLGGGWRSDDKTATVAAWLALHGPGQATPARRAGRRRHV